MKLSEIFSRKENTHEASTFSTQPTINFGVGTIGVPSHTSCNCARELLGIGQDDDRAPRTPEQKQDFHKNILGHWLSMMFEKDDAKRVRNASRLAELHLTNKPAQEDSEFANHFLMHLHGAGMTHKDLGFDEKDLGENYRSSQQAADVTRAVALSAPTTFHEDHCGVCEQYLTALKNHSHKFKDEIAKTMSERRPDSTEEIEPTASGAAKRVFDIWQSGGRVNVGSSHALASGQSILDNWDKHLKDSHDSTLMGDHYRHTPVVEDKEGFVDKLYNSLQGIRPGWSIRKRRDIPTKDPFWSEQTESYRVLPGMPEKAAEEGAAAAAKEVDVIRRPATMPERTIKAPSEPYTKEEKANAPKGGLEPRPLRDVTVPATPTKTVVKLPRTRLEGFGPLDRFPAIFTREPTFTNVEHVYDPSKDPSAQRLTDVVGTDKAPEITHPELRGMLDKLPEHHLFAFQEAGMVPNLDSLHAYTKAKSDYETQPNSKLVQTETGAYKSEPIPESERIQPPSEEMLNNARTDYATQFNKALAAAVPFVNQNTPEGIEKAMQSLQESHARSRKRAEEARNISLDPRNRRIQASKKGTKVVFNAGKEQAKVTFNSRNDQ